MQYWGPGASLIAQWVKNLRAIQETPFDSWFWKIRWRRDSLPTPVLLGFPCGSAGKESACNAGDLGLIPGLGRSPWEGKGYPLQYSGLENSTDCMGSQRVGHDWATFTFTSLHWGPSRDGAPEPSSSLSFRMWLGSITWKPQILSLSTFLAMTCGSWDLSSPTRDWTWAPAVKAPNPNHWTTRECLLLHFTDVESKDQKGEGTSTKLQIDGDKAGNRIQSVFWWPIRFSFYHWTLPSWLTYQKDEEESKPCLRRMCLISS